MKNKKGFTLIELLAIIVILAIIAVITVPIILGIIEDASKGAASDSAYGFKDSVNKYYVSELVKDSNFKLEDGTYTVSEVNGNAVLTGEETYTISLSGTIPTGGSVIIENNDVVGGNIQIGNYCINLSDMTVTKGSCGDTPIAQATPESCFEYEDNGDNTVTITGYTCGGQVTEFDEGKINSYTNGEYMDVVIPNKIDGKNVTAIGEIAFSPFIYNRDWEISYDRNVIINSVVIPNGVTTIDESAFENNQLTSVTIPDSVTEIGSEAFAVNQLTNITIPSSVTYIGNLTFAVNQLTSVTIPDSVTYIGEGAFNSNELSDSDAFIYARNEDGTEDKTIIVSYGGINKNPIVPSSVTYIGDDAFYANELTSVEIPNSVTSIGDFAFSYNQLTSVTLGNSVTSIGNHAFQENQLTSVTIPDSVTEIGSYAFEFNQLTSLTLGNSVTSIEEYAFGDNQLTSVTIPNSVTDMGENVFALNPNITINVIGYNSKPDGWTSSWNAGYPVNWNYQG